MPLRLMLMWTVRTLLVAVTQAVCLLPLGAQDFDGAAKVLVMTGRVSIIRDNNEWALNAGSVVQPRQVIITGQDGYAKFELSDGSTFEVFQNSRAVFRPNTGWLDLLDLWIGHVKVYIQHKNGPNYNRVNTQTAVISVRGTVFDVAAEDEDTTFVSVDEGAVSVRHARLPGEIVLNAGESTRVYKDQPLARRVDKGGIGRQALRVAAQAVYDTLARRGIGGAGGTSSGGGASTGAGGAQGDKGKGTGTGTGTSEPPAPPPPPPPPSN